MFNKFVILSLIFLFNFNTNANPAPLGIEINKSTLSDVRKLYKILHKTKNVLAGYHNNLLDIKNAKIPNIVSLEVVTDENEIIVGVSVSFTKDSFDPLFKVLNKSYGLIYSKKPEDADKYAEFSSEDYFIDMKTYRKNNLLDVKYFSKYYLNKVILKFQKEKVKIIE